MVGQDSPTLYVGPDFKNHFVFVEKINIVSGKLFLKMYGIGLKPVCAQSSLVTQTHSGPPWSLGGKLNII